MSKSINTVIFDLGGVLIDWNPRYVYRSIFKTEQEIDWFFEHITTSHWNENQDAGYPLAQATEDLVAKHPEWEAQIRAYYGRWEEMLGGPIHETVEILQEIKQKHGIKTYALTNWSAETFPVALKRFDFLHWFDGRLVSGEEKTRKPFPDFYQKLIDKFSINPLQAVFIDDNLRNVKGGEEHGMIGIHFKNATELKKTLGEMGIL